MATNHTVIQHHAIMDLGLSGRQFCALAALSDLLLGITRTIVMYDICDHAPVLIPLKGQFTWGAANSPGSLAGWHLHFEV